ncbi:MAG: hypothetical protein H6Q90_2514 [Deltaproteobacteria bacterium]|nr:hypothetical protein [Deltaproteobacteria bacterium]
MELRRADIGIGRVIIDDHGVSRRGLVHTHALAWLEIRDYRLTIEFHGQAPDALYLADDLLGAVLFARDVAAASRGESRIRLAIELVGRDDRVEFGALRFRHANEAIAKIVEQVHPRLLAAARAELAEQGVVHFGPLALARDAITWSGRSPLPRDEVESVELFDTSPACLRVMAHGKALPYGKAPTAEIPNLGAALELAAELGYRAHRSSLFIRGA